MFCPNEFVSFANKTISSFSPISLKILEGLNICAFSLNEPTGSLLDALKELN